MNYEDPSQCDEAECRAAFARLFPPEFWCETALGQLAPDGWGQSPLRFAFHPTLQQVYEEALRIHHNLATLGKAKKPPSPEPTLAEVEAEIPRDAD